MSLKEQLQAIQESAVERKSELAATDLERRRIEGDRQRAMDQAAKPFDEQLRQTEQRIAELENQRPMRLFRSAALDEIVRDALFIESRAVFSGNDPIDALAANYEASLEENAGSRRIQTAPRILGKVAHFETLLETLESASSEIPFVAARFGWSELEDIQAREEGRNSRTGNYMRTGTIVLGRIAFHNVFARRTEARHTDGVDLLVNGMLQIDGDYNYYYERELRANVARHATITLFGKPTGNAIHEGRVAWDMSNEAQLMHNQGSQHEAFSAIAWGDGANALADQIKTDEYVISGLRQLVAEHYERETAI